MTKTNRSTPIARRCSRPVLGPSGITRREACGLAAAGLAGAALGMTGCGSQDSDQVLYVFNWGEYIDEEVLDIFEEETGIHVVYDTFETNEAMYPIIEQGQTKYDLVCPSDYMIAKMIENDLLAEINFDNIPNFKYIGQSYIESSYGFDEGCRHSIPYMWGTLGILYNTTMMDKAPTKWADMWDEQYKDNILMYKSVRDCFVAPFSILGYSINATDPAQIEAARDLLIEQKPLVQAYVVDQVRDKMIGGEAAMGMIYSGEYLFCKESNPDLAYVVPEEGSNIFIDSWVIPANAENKENAEKFLDFLCRPDIALRNFEYITYASPNTGAQEQIDEEILNDPGCFADDEMVKRCDVFTWLGDEVEAIYNDCWTQLMAAK